MSLNSVLLGTEMCAVCDIVRVCRHFCTRLYFNIAIFNHLLRTGDLPCKVYVYTIPGTTNPTFTSCMASDLEPEALPSVEGRSFDLLDDIHDQVVDIVESQSGISTEQASQLVSTVFVNIPLRDVKEGRWRHPKMKVAGRQIPRQTGMRCGVVGVHRKLQEILQLHFRFVC